MQQQGQQSSQDMADNIPAPPSSGMGTTGKTLCPKLSYGVHRIDNLDQLPLTCLTAMKQRLTREIKSVPQSRKAAQFQRALLG